MRAGTLLAHPPYNSDGPTPGGSCDKFVKRQNIAHIDQLKTEGDPAKRKTLETQDAGKPPGWGKGKQVGLDTRKFGGDEYGAH